MQLTAEIATFLLSLQHLTTVRNGRRDVAAASDVVAASPVVVASNALSAFPSASSSTAVAAFAIALE